MYLKTIVLYVYMSMRVCLQVHDGLFFTPPGLKSVLLYLYLLISLFLHVFLGLNIVRLSERILVDHTDTSVAKIIEPKHITLSALIHFLST